MQVAGRTVDTEALNRKALKLAREVADATGTLMAGNICNTVSWGDGSQEKREFVRSIFKVSLPLSQSMSSLFFDC